MLHVLCFVNGSKAKFLFDCYRLKQMEEEFHKFVSISEISKDLNLPKELAAKIHKYWILKRKVQ